MRWLVRAALLLAASCAAVRLSTRLGEIEGKRLATPRTGKEYFAFTSVPYAEPPVGHLRLKNPVLHKGWNGTLDATIPAPMCTQSIIFVASLRNKVFGQEDCLNLNIYTPTIDDSKSLPVLVYIHGGGFRCGMPQESAEAPTNFIEEDVIVVTVHYRVGVLGFLSTEDGEIPGNFGLKDQAMALKWLSQNIDQFGGDPKLLTVFGESAGGASAHYLITSPLSRDLLKGAIAESGVADACWALAKPGLQRKQAEKISQMFGCDISNGLLKCLQQVNAEELIKAEYQFLFWDFDPGVVFQPVVEIENDGAFITQDPKSITVTKPLITGIVPGEGMIKTSSLFTQGESILDEFITNVDEMLPKIMGAEVDPTKQADFISVLKSRYFKDMSNRQEVLKGLEEFYRDILFIFPMYKALERHRGPKYAYIFDHKAPYSNIIKMGATGFKYEVASHGDEVLSLFNTTSSFSGIKVREEDRQLSMRLVKLWSNFAKYQNPTPAGSKVTWKQYEHGVVLRITTDKDKLDLLPYDDVADFWEEALKIIEGPRLRKEEL